MTRVALAVSLLGASLQAQTVDNFGLFYRANYNQQGTGGAVTSSTPYSFYAEVHGSDLGDFGSISFTDPSANTQGIFIAPNGSNATRTFGFSNTTNLFNSFPFGTYTFTMGGGSTTLDLSDAPFPNTGSILGGNWVPSGFFNRLEVPDGDFTFNFTPPSNTDLVRLRIYQQENPFDSFIYETAGTNSSILVPDADLVLGLNYGATLDYINIVDSSTTFGSTGLAGYMSRTEFNFVVVEPSAIPEPTTAAMLLAGGFLMLRRRRS